MANIFRNLPMPGGGTGPGASVDVSAMGRDKSIVVGGTFAGLTVAIEVSVDGGTVFQPIHLFSEAGKRVIPVAAEFMRVNVQGLGAGPFTATADIGANDIGALFLVLPPPAGDGAGAPVDVSSLGNFTTFVVGGAFRDVTVSIEISEDGVNYFACGTSFAGQGGIQSKVVIANFMRVFVRGRAGNTFPFTPTISVGAVLDDPVVPITVAALPTDFIEGLRIHWNAEEEISIRKGSCRDSTDSADIIRTSTISSLALFVSGVNGLDTGAEAASTWYAVYLIGDTSGTEPVASVFSLSFVAPTLPAGYDVFRRIGAVRNNAASDIVKFTQTGVDKTRRMAHAQVAGGEEEIVSAFTGSSAIQVTDASAVVPPSSKRGLFAMLYITTLASHFVVLADVDGIQISWIGPGLAASQVRSSVENVVDDSQQLRWKNASVSQTTTIFGIGYYDDL